MSVALVSAATATATALTVGVEPPPAPAKRIATENVDLAAAIRLLPNHDQIPDITGGLGTALYDANQGIADQLIRALVNGIDFAAVAQAAGVDPKNIVTSLLANVPSNLLPGILESLGLQLPVVGPVLQQLGLGSLSSVLSGLGITDVTDGTLTGLLALIGLDLSDPLDLSALGVPGVNVVTAGPTFTALKLFGLDLGWVPSLPNSVANDINGSQYLKAGADGVLNTVLDRLNALNVGGLLGPLLTTLGVNLPVSQILGTLTSALTNVTGAVPDLIDVRADPTIGIGAGAFATAMAYQEVIADLANQPGGSNYENLTGELNPLLGSLTILPMILINNPARPDGGILARFADIASLVGINTVNPTTQATSENGTIPVGNTGLSLGGANVLPILVDATYEYEPLSDFASWPDAFTLFNNLAAGLSPTYLLRGFSGDGLETQLLDQVTAAVGNVAAGNPLALNIYLTLHSSTLPTLEPLYLASDALNLVGLNPVAAFVTHLANALAPALTTLVNIGYADAVQNPDGTITRDLTDAGTETPFLSFPAINYGEVPGDVIKQLLGGFQKEFFSGNPTPSGPNVLSTLLNAISGGLGGILPAATTATTPTTPAAVTPVSALAVAAVPAAKAKLVSVASVKAPTATANGGDQTAAAADQTAAATDDTPVNAPSPKAPKHANPEEDSAPATGDQATGDQATGGKHTRHDAASDPTGTGGDVTAPDTGTKKPPKHAKPTTTDGADNASDSSPTGDKSAKHGKHAKGSEGASGTSSDKAA